MNSIQRQFQPFKPTDGIQCQFHSKTDSTIQPTNRIQGQFHSETDSTIKPTNVILASIPFKDRFNIKPTNRIQNLFHSKTDSTFKTGFKVNSIQRQIQPLNPKIGFNVNAIQKWTDSTINSKNRFLLVSIPVKDRFNYSTHNGFNVNSIQTGFNH